MSLPLLASSLCWHLCRCWVLHFAGVSAAAGFFTLLAFLPLLASSLCWHLCRCWLHFVDVSAAAGFLTLLAALPLLASGFRYSCVCWRSCVADAPALAIMSHWVFWRHCYCWCSFCCYHVSLRLLASLFLLLLSYFIASVPVLVDAPALAIMFHCVCCFQCLTDVLLLLVFLTKEYWMIYGGPGSLAIVWFGSSLTRSPSPPGRRHTGRLKKKYILLTGEGGGGGGKLYQGEKACSSITHPVFYGIHYQF